MNEYTKIIRQVANRINAIKGAQGTPAQSNYMVEPITATEMDSAPFPYGAIVDAVIDAEGLIAQVVGQTSNHPWRSFLYQGELSRDGGLGLEHGDRIYQVNGLPVTNAIGLGRVLAVSGDICVEASLENIRRWRDNQTMFALTHWFYRIVDEFIYHTAPAGVTISYYGFDAQPRYDAVNANTEPLFPTSATPAYVTGALSLLLKQDEYMGQAQHYAGLFAQQLAAIGGGFTAVDTQQPSTPVTGPEIR